MLDSLPQDSVIADRYVGFVVEALLRGAKVLYMWLILS